jgi:NitT/TauT family transport system permease protein
VSPIAALAVWKLASLAIDRDIILPPPERTAAELVRIVLAPEFLPTVGITLGRVLLAFALAFSAAVFLGLGAGLSRGFEELLHAPVTVVRSVPTMGVILLSLIWLDSEGAPLLVTALVAFPIIYAATVAAIRGIDADLIEMHKVFRIGFARRLANFYVPAVAPQVSAGMAAALGLTMKVMIAAEVLSQPRRGIGTMFQIERARLNTPGVFAWCAIVILIAAGLDLLLARATRSTGDLKGERIARARSRL